MLNSSSHTCSQGGGSAKVCVRLVGLNLYTGEKVECKADQGSPITTWQHDWKALEVVAAATGQAVTAVSCIPLFDAGGRCMSSTGLAVEGRKEGQGAAKHCEAVPVKVEVHADYAPHRISDREWQEGIRGMLSESSAGEGGEGDCGWKAFDREAFNTACDRCNAHKSACQVLVYNVPWLGRQHHIVAFREVPNPDWLIE
jgi:hypothetical protein